jgi:hypothetical protein
MRACIARSNGSLLLLIVMLTSAILPWVSPVRRVLQAALNCQTRQCVQVPYMANGPGDSRNIFCVRYRAEFEGVRNWGKAYSAQVAVSNCYGQDSVGGTVSNDVKDRVAGHYWEAECTPDCADVPADSLCSGRAARYVSGPQQLSFSTKCVVEAPPPPPPPEPDPDPDP